MKCLARMHFVSICALRNASGKIYGHAYLMGVKEQNILVSMQSYLYFKKEKNGKCMHLQYAAYPKRIGNDAGENRLH